MAPRKKSQTKRQSLGKIKEGRVHKMVLRNQKPINVTNIMVLRNRKNGENKFVYLTWENRKLVQKIVGLIINPSSIHHVISPPKKMKKNKVSNPKVKKLQKKSKTKLKKKNKKVRKMELETEVIYPVVRVNNKVNITSKPRKCLVQKTKIKWRLEDFKDIIPIADGSFGYIYKAFAIPTETFCVLKYLKLSKTEMNEDYLKKILSETYIQQMAIHDHIVRHWGQFEFKDTYIFVMDFYSLGDLHDVMYKPPNDHQDAWFTNNQINLFTRQIVSAIEYIHYNMGYIHKDLKPENIMVANKMCIKVTDFGCALKIVSNRFLHVSSGIGTPCYHPPEELFSKTFDSTADVWAIGCIVFEMLTKEKPFMEVGKDDLIFYSFEKLKAMQIGKYHTVVYDNLMSTNPKASTFLRQIFVQRICRPLVRGLTGLTWLNG